MNIPKDHKKVEHYLTFGEIEGPIGEVGDRLAEIAKEHGILEPEIVLLGSWDPEPYLVGYRPMTEKELASRERARAAARVRVEKAQKTQKEKDLKEIKRLAEKHGVKIDV